MKPRVLFLYPYLPSPEAAHGSARIVSDLLARLRPHAEISLVCVHRPAERDLVDSVRPLCHRLHAVERRFASEMGRVRRATEVGTTGLRWLKTGWPVPVVKLRRDAIRRAVLRALAEDRPEILHVELATMAQYRLDVPDLPALLVDHEAAGESADRRWREYVQTVYPRFDALACLSEEDAAEVLLRLGGEPPRVRAPAFAWPAALEARPEADRVLFFGSLDHAPNRDALSWISEEILPALRARRPGVRLVAAGFPPDGAEEASRAAEAGVEILGFVPDLATELSRAAAVVAPVRLGAGVRIKNLETLAAGVPLVTTPLGARGLPSGAARVGGTTEELVGELEELLADPVRARAQAASSRRAVLAANDPERQAEHTLEMWEALRTGFSQASPADPE